MDILCNIDKRAFRVFFSIVFFVAGGILGVIFQEIVTGIINDSLSVMLLILVLIVSITVMISIIFAYVLRLSRPKARVRYYEFPPKREAELYTVASKVVRRAQEEILATTAPQLDDWSDQSDRVGIPHREYFQLLLSLNQNPSKRIRYTRVLQLQEGNPIPHQIGSKVFLEHLHKLVDQRDRQGIESKLSLTRVPLYRPLTLVLVDQRCLMWEVDEHVEISREEGQDYVHMRGLLVIDDSTQKLLKPFHEFLDGIARGGSQVNKSELPSLRGGQE